MRVDEREKARWARVLEDSTPAGSHARTILGMATDRLAVGDFPWTVATIFAAFDPALGRERAAQLWDGRLTQSRWFWGTVEGLRPHLDRMLRESAALLPARATELGDFIALLAADVENSGITRETLHLFVQHASAEARSAFAEALPDKCETLTEAARERTCRDRLRGYWNDRRTNMPLALAADELGVMTR